MSKTLDKYITVPDYTDKTLHALSSARSGISLYSFTTVISTPVGIESARIILVLLSVMVSSKCS